MPTKPRAGQSGQLFIDNQYRIRHLGDRHPKTPAERTFRDAQSFDGYVSKLRELGQVVTFTNPFEASVTIQ